MSAADGNREARKAERWLADESVRKAQQRIKVPYTVYATILVHQVLAGHKAN